MNRAHPAGRAVLLIVDFFNPLDFDGGRRLARPALAAARATAKLRERCGRARIPVVYANDNFGRWNADFREVAARCLALGGAPAALARALFPRPADLRVLKPRHSAFYGTPLEFLLEDLRKDTVILAGIAADSCVLATALDAHVRRFRLWVPRDCVASEAERLRSRALAQMERTARAYTGPSRAGLSAGLRRADARA